MHDADADASPVCCSSRSSTARTRSPCQQVRGILLSGLTGSVSPPSAAGSMQSHGVCFEMRQSTSLSAPSMLDRVTGFMTDPSAYVLCSPSACMYCRQVRSTCARQGRPDRHGARSCCSVQLHSHPCVDLQVGAATWVAPVHDSIPLLSLVLTIFLNRDCRRLRLGPGARHAHYDRLTHLTATCLRRAWETVARRPSAPPTRSPGSSMCRPAPTTVRPAASSAPLWQSFRITLEQQPAAITSRDRCMHCDLVHTWLYAL